MLVLTQGFALNETYVNKITQAQAYLGVDSKYNISKKDIYVSYFQTRRLNTLVPCGYQLYSPSGVPKIS